MESDRHNFQKLYYIHNRKRRSYLLCVSMPTFKQGRFLFFLSCSEFSSVLLFYTWSQQHISQSWEISFGIGERESNLYKAYKCISFHQHGSSCIPKFQSYFKPNFTSKSIYFQTTVHLFTLLGYAMYTDKRLRCSFLQSCLLATIEYFALSTGSFGWAISVCFILLRRMNF